MAAELENSVIDTSNDNGPLFGAASQSTIALSYRRAIWLHIETDIGLYTLGGILIYSTILNCLDHVQIGTWTTTGCRGGSTTTTKSTIMSTALEKFLNNLGKKYRLRIHSARKYESALPTRRARTLQRISRIIGRCFPASDLIPNMDSSLAWRSASPSCTHGCALQICFDQSFEAVACLRTCLRGRLKRCVRVHSLRLASSSHPTKVGLKAAECTLERRATSSIVSAVRKFWRASYSSPWLNCSP
eukprot:SAG11_NODE_2932_length_2830_cov_1.773709_2_plen_245_part_00